MNYLKRFKNFYVFIFLLLLNVHFCLNISEQQKNSLFRILCFFFSPSPGGSEFKESLSHVPLVLHSNLNILVSGQLQPNLDVL